MRAFIATQIGCDPANFGVYAQRDETRRKHLVELQAYLAVHPLNAKTSASSRMSQSNKQSVLIVATLLFPDDRTFARAARSASGRLLGENRIWPRAHSLANAPTRISSKACPRNDRRIGSAARRRRQSRSHAARLAGGMAGSAATEEFGRCCRTAASRPKARRRIGP
jgi:hypothetical protein